MEVKYNRPQQITTMPTNILAYDSMHQPSGDILQYIEHHNNYRIHSYNDYMTPAKAE